MGAADECGLGLVERCLRWNVSGSLEAVRKQFTRHLGLLSVALVRIVGG